MKTINSDLKTHIESEVTTLATCYKITRKNEEILGFTSLDQNLIYDGVTYVASKGFDKDNLFFNTTIEKNKTKIKSLISSDLISENDLLTGKYDGAKIEIFIVNFEDLTMEKMILFIGFFGKVSCIGGKFIVNLENLNSKLESTMGNFYTPTCRARFCDSKCNLAETNYKFSGSIHTVSSNSQFYCDDSAVKTKETGYFNYGYLTFTSGNNNGISVEIRQSNDGNILFSMKAPFDITTDDTFDIVAGCDKKFLTCKNKFSNAVNFRGEPHVPGMEFLLGTK